jgi:hypothetical protein
MIFSGSQSRDGEAESERRIVEAGELMNVTAQAGPQDASVHTGIRHRQRK